MSATDDRPADMSRSSLTEFTDCYASGFRRCGAWFGHGGLVPGGVGGQLDGTTNQSPSAVAVPRRPVRAGASP